MSYGKVRHKERVRSTTHHAQRKQQNEHEQKVFVTKLPIEISQLEAGSPCYSGGEMAALQNVLQRDAIVRNAEASRKTPQPPQDRSPSAAPER